MFFSCIVIYVSLKVGGWSWRRYTPLWKDRAILQTQMRQPFWLRGTSLPQGDHCRCAHQYLKTGSIASIEVHSLLLQATEDTSVFTGAYIRSLVKEQKQQQKKHHHTVLPLCSPSKKWERLWECALKLRKRQEHSHPKPGLLMWTFVS